MTKLPHAFRRAPVPPLVAAVSLTLTLFAALMAALAPAPPGLALRERLEDGRPSQAPPAGDADPIMMRLGRGRVVAVGTPSRAKNVAKKAASLAATLASSNATASHAAGTPATAPVSAEAASAFDAEAPVLFAIPPPPAASVPVPVQARALEPAPEANAAPAEELVELPRLEQIPAPRKAEDRVFDAPGAVLMFRETVSRKPRSAAAAAAQRAVPPAMPIGAGPGMSLAESVPAVVPAGPPLESLAPPAADAIAAIRAAGVAASEEAVAAMRAAGNAGSEVGLAGPPRFPDAVSAGPFAALSAGPAAGPSAGPSGGRSAAATPVGDSMQFADAPPRALPGQERIEPRLGAAPQVPSLLPPAGAQPPPAPNSTATALAALRRAPAPTGGVESIGGLLGAGFRTESIGTLISSTASLRALPTVQVTTDPTLPEIKNPRLELGDRVPPMQTVAEIPLAPFGYDFFRSGRSALPSLPEIFDVPEDYKLGPRDAFTVHIFGKVIDETYPVEVNSQGHIVVPRAGELYVAGMRYGDLNAFLFRELSKYVKSVQVSTNFTRLRTFSVMVSGEVEAPGIVVANALSTVLTALVQSGGPSARGSLRRVRVVRGGKVVAEVDLYDLLARGDPGNPVRLEAGDIVFVPVVGSTAAIYGMVRRPAIYELKGGERLLELIGLAGGLSPGAYGGLIQLVRTSDRRERRWSDIVLQGNWEDQVRQVPIHDGDVVHVPRLALEVENTVEVRGHVRRPGRYQWRPGLTVGDLVHMAEGTKPGAFLRRVEIVRTLEQARRYTFNSSFPAQSGQEVIAVDLISSATGAGAETQVAPRDVLVILKEAEVQPQSAVAVVGEVSRPGQYDLLVGMRVSDLVYRAGGVRVAAQMARAEISRRLPNGKLAIIPVNLSRALANDRPSDPLLENLDILSVYTDPQRRDRVRVTVRGQVGRPGTYEMFRGQRLTDLIERAGGFAAGAFLPGVEFRRETVRQRQLEDRDRYVREQRRQLLETRFQARVPAPIGTPAIATANEIGNAAALEQAEKLLEALQLAELKGRVAVHLDPFETFKQGRENVELEDGDVLEVPRVPAEIVVSGEVKNAAAFVYERGRTVGDYIRLAGGLTTRAHRREIFLIRPDGTAISSSSLPREVWNGVHLNRARVRDFYETPVTPGDQIVVPFDLRVKIDRTARNVDIISKALTSFAIVLNAIK